MAPFTSSSLSFSTPPASPATLQRRSQEQTCPSLKRKRNDGDAQDDVMDDLVACLDRHSHNKRRSLHQDRQLHVPLHSQSRHPHSRFLFLNAEQVSGAPSLPVLSGGNGAFDLNRANDDGLPSFSLRPRPHSYQSVSIDDLSQEQDENDPPSALKGTTDACEAAFATSRSERDLLRMDDTQEMDILPPVGSPAPKKSALQRSSSTGSASFLGTPLDAVQLTLSLSRSLSKRKLSFEFARRDSVSSSSNCQTPGNTNAAGTAAATLIQSLEGLCLPSLEDGVMDNGSNVNAASADSAAATATTRTTLQQKRPPSTPGNNRGLAVATFDYLATALRLPDLALSGGSR